MRLPTGEVIMHAGQPYDAQKAHEYYMRTRKLKGRKRGSTPPPTGGDRQPAGPAARAQRKKELQQKVQNLEEKLKKLEALIRKKESEARKSEAKKERKAKEADKPDTAAEKAEKARDAEKYRKKNRQKLKAKAKRARGKGGSGGGSDKPLKDRSVTDLKKLATRVKGQLAVAKQKLRAL
jgi:hypothetical protein